MGRADLFPRAKAEARTADGIVFDSKREMERYYELKTLQKTEEIRDLKWQIQFKFYVNDQLVGSYKPDFQYLTRTGAVVVEDVKAWRRTPKTGKLVPIVNREFRYQRALMKTLFSLDVQLV